MTNCRRSSAFKLQFVGREEGEWGWSRDYGTTFRRILCPLAVPYSVWLEYGKKSGTLYYRIYPKMEHPISRQNDKPCRPSLQSDLGLYCLLRPVIYLELFGSFKIGPTGVIYKVIKCDYMYQYFDHCSSTGAALARMKG